MVFWAVLFINCLSFFVNIAKANELPEDVIMIKEKLITTTNLIQISETYKQTLVHQMFGLTSVIKEELFESSQFFLLVDRNPNSQTISLAFFDANEKMVTILGTEKTSTGKPSRIGSYETPVGIFQNNPKNMSYRALGTKNSKGWRGFGIKGSRVWDLGWQKSKHPKGGDINIRMLVHATDPDFGEKRLGQQDSKGCVRLSAKLNRFLDYYGIIDAEYEKNPKGKYVLLKDRLPVNFAGSLIVVIDTTETIKM